MQPSDATNHPPTRESAKIFKSLQIISLQTMLKNAMHSLKMHIACPNCQAVYDVPQSMLEASTVLRCHLCQHSWTLNDISPQAEQPQSLAPQQAVEESPSWVVPLVVEPPPIEETPSLVVPLVVEPDPTPEPSQPDLPESSSPEPFAAPAQAEASAPDYVVHLGRSTPSTMPHANAKKTGQPDRNTSTILLGGAALVLAALTVALLARHGIVKNFPASAGFFKALGIS